MKQNQVKDSASKVLELVNDQVELNQKIGEIGCRILLKTPEKLDQIISIKNDDLENTSINMINKLKTNFPKLSGIKDMLKSYINEEESKHPALKLGRNDADKIITEWVKGTIPKDEKIGEKFVKIAVANRKTTEDKINEGEIAPQELTVDEVRKECPRQCSCAMFLCDVLKRFFKITNINNNR